MPRILTGRLVAAAILLPLLPACRSTESAESSEEVSVAWLVREERYAEAEEIARRQAEKEPGNRRAQILLRDVRVMRTLEAGRNAVFAGEPEEGLVYFYRAAELDPESHIVRNWIRKTNVQLAEQWLDRAANLRGPDDLDQAEAAYEKVLHYDPENASARQGLASLLLRKNYREGMGQTYFDQGMRDLRAFDLHAAKRDFEVSLKYDARHESAGRRLTQVQRDVASEQLSQAQALEAAGLYHAAHNQYRIALILNPDDEVAQDGLDRMDLETRAQGVLSQADMHVRRGDLDKAEELLDESRPLTAQQEDEVGALSGRIEDARLSTLYDEARTLERDYKYPQAVDAYAALLELAPYYEDAISRKATIEEFIAQAEDLYTRALDSEREEEALELLRQIPILWPEYRDVEQRILALEAKLAASAEEGAAGSEEANPADADDAEPEDPQGDDGEPDDAATEDGETEDGETGDGGTGGEQDADDPGERAAGESEDGGGV